MPEAIERNTLWLAREHVAGRDSADVLQLINEYKDQLLHALPIEGDGATFKAIVVVFPDLSGGRAKGFFDGVLEKLAASSYADDGVVLGGFYESNEGGAIRNPGFRPFTPPVPFLLMRLANISDWKFFLDKEDWLLIWARRFRESAVRALAEELRRLPWRANV